MSSRSGRRHHVQFQEAPKHLFGASSARRGPWLGYPDETFSRAPRAHAEVRLSDSMGACVVSARDGAGSTRRPASPRRLVGWFDRHESVLLASAVLGIAIWFASMAGAKTGWPALKISFASTSAAVPAVRPVAATSVVATPLPPAAMPVPTLIAPPTLPAPPPTTSTSASASATAPVVAAKPRAPKPRPVRAPEARPADSERVTTATATPASDPNVTERAKRELANVQRALAEML